MSYLRSDKNGNVATSSLKRERLDSLITTLLKTKIIYFVNEFISYKLLIN